MVIAEIGPGAGEGLGAGAEAGYWDWQGDGAIQIIFDAALYTNKEFLRDLVFYK